MTNAMTDESTVDLDPHGLLASGEELATEPELSKLLGVPRAALRSLLRGPLHEHVRFVRAKPGPWRYSVADARAAVAVHMPELEERRRQAGKRQGEEQAAAKARRAATAVAHAAHVARRAKRVPAPKPTPRAGPSPGGPEVIVRRRLGSQ